MDIPLSCPDFTVLSRLLRTLSIKVPRYKKTEKPDDNVHAIAIDSTGLKRFWRGEWHREKYELSSKARWRKLHLAINQDHYIEACVLTIGLVTMTSRLRHYWNKLTNQSISFLVIAPMMRRPFMMPSLNTRLMLT
jgi:hypothetical protein